MISSALACPAPEDFDLTAIMQHVSETNDTTRTDAELFILLPVAIGVLFAIRRAWQADRLQTVGSPISLQFAKSVARRTVHRVAGRAIIAVSVAIALYAQQQLPHAIVVGAFAFDSLLCLIRASRVVARLESSARRVEHRGTWLCVDELYLHCGRRVWNSAALFPTATLASRHGFSTRAKSTT
jgi:hypothetical protein